MVAATKVITLLGFALTAVAGPVHGGLLKRVTTTTSTSKVATTTSAVASTVASSSSKATTSTVASTVASSSSKATTTLTTSTSTSAAAATTTTATTTQQGLVGGLVAVVTGLGGIVGTVGGAAGSVPALVEASCSSDFTSCSATISGEIENMLSDGAKWTGRATVNAYTVNGVAYGNATLAGVTPSPTQWTISCNATANVCTGNITGSVNAVFSNGKQLVAWGWLSPSGHCNNGTCYGSITTVGDPYYKRSAGSVGSFMNKLKLF